ncbi:hypothetical protein CBL_04463 [Carabus blaptoides fortunei]
MLVSSVFVICFCLFYGEANKIGLLDHSHEERSTTSLKTEILKFKTSECGGSSSEESYEKSTKKSKKNQNSDESDSSDSEETTKKRRRNKNNAARNNRHRNNDDSNSGDYESQGYNYGHSGPGTYPGRSSGHNMYQQPQYQDPYPPRTMSRPTNEQYPSRGGLPYPSMEQDPYQRPGGARPYGGRPEMSYADRGTGSYQGRYPYQNGRETFPNRDMYSGARDRQDSREDSRNSHHRREHSSKDSRKHESKRKSNKKPMKNDSDEECVSQCVFNNMDIMEDDGIPSESAMIKWAQDKIKNDKMKSAAVKEIRKCFGTLATSDGDNSCQFATSLASCLHLDLDEN